VLLTTPGLQLLAPLPWALARRPLHAPPVGLPAPPAGVQLVRRSFVERLRRSVGLSAQRDQPPRLMPQRLMPQGRQRCQPTAHHSCTCERLTRPPTHTTATTPVCPPWLSRRSPSPRSSATHPRPSAAKLPSTRRFLKGPTAPMLPRATFVTNCSVTGPRWPLRSLGDVAERCTAWNLISTTLLSLENSLLRRRTSRGKT
jgi:hypothetical protein